MAKAKHVFCRAGNVARVLVVLRSIPIRGHTIWKDLTTNGAASRVVTRAVLYVTVLEVAGIGQTTQGRIARCDAVGVHGVGTECVVASGKEVRGGGEGTREAGVGGSGVHGWVAKGRASKLVACPIRWEVKTLA